MIRVTQVLEATAGGTRRHLRELVAALPASEFDVRIVAAVRRDHAFERDLEAFQAEGRRVRVLDMVRAARPLADLRAARALRLLLEQEPSDLVHLHSSKAGWIGRLAAGSLPCRIVYTPHAFPFLQRVSPLWRGAYRLAERWGARRTDALFAVGQAEGRVAVEQVGYPSGRVHVLPNAVDPDRVRDEVGERAPRASGEPARVALGADLRPQKDPLTFLRAGARLLAAGRPVRLLLPEHGALLGAARREAARLGIAHAVEFVPVDDDLVPLLRRADLCVLCSLWEGLPYTMLDALALGLPLVASDIPPLAEVLAPLEPGLLVAPGDPAALAGVVGRWLDAPPARVADLALRAEARLRGEHDLARWGVRVRALYRELVA